MKRNYILALLVIFFSKLGVIEAAECLSSVTSISIVSLDSNGQQANNRNGTSAMDYCGDRVVFQSFASNLVASDTNLFSDFFLRFNTTTSRISVATDGTEGNNDSGVEPIFTGQIASLNDDGNLIVFSSEASNLVANDTNGVNDIFLHDTNTGKTIRISVASDGTEANNFQNIGSQNSQISADGQYIVYQSSSSNLVPADNNNAVDIFRYEISTGITERVNVPNLANQADLGLESNSSSRNPTISSDGRYIVFDSQATNLVIANDPQFLVRNIYLHDATTKSTTSITQSRQSSLARSSGEWPTISADASTVAFYSNDFGISGGSSSINDIFIWNRLTNSYTNITQGDDSSFKFGISISHDGRYITFQSDASNLTPGETTAGGIFVHDAQLSVTQRVNVSVDGTISIRNSIDSNPTISGDGRYITFSSDGDNLVANDNNFNEDIFLAPNSLYQLPLDTTPQNESNAGTQFSSTAIDPIDTYNGEFFTQKAIELNLGGPMPLYFQRYYAAFLRRSFIVGDLGNNWRHNFDARLYQLPSNQYKYVTHDGRVTEFTLNQVTGNWDQDTNLDTPYQITVVAGQDANIYDPTIDRIYTFDLTTSSTIIGKLIKIEDGKGNTHTVVYDLANAQIQSVSDGLGRTLNFTYNNDAIPKISVVDDGARSISFQYTDPNDTENLTMAMDANLRPTLFVYKDTSGTSANYGLMRFMTRAEGNSPYVQTYFDNTDPLTSGRVATQTDSDGNTFQLDYNNLETTITDPLSNTRVHTHTSTGEFASREDENGLSFTMGSDSTGRRNSLTDRLGDTTSATYNADNGDIESVTNADGTSFSFDYSARVFNGVTFQDITGISHTDSTTESIVYDVFGNPISYTNQLGDESTATYNSFGQVLTSRNTEGGITTNTYNADATLATSSDSAGNSTIFGYDAFRRLNLLTFADTNTRSLIRDDSDNLLTSTNENGNTTTRTYDLNSNLQTLQDELLQTTNFAYDGNDRLLSFTNPLGATSSQTFNAIGKLASVTDANNNVLSFGYNPLGRRTSLTDPLGNVWNSSYDLEGILASITDPLANTTTYTSDNMGRITQVFSPLGNTFDTAYDNMGRIISTTNGLGETTNYLRDANGLLSEIALSGNLVTASYVRNKLGLITTIVDPGGNSWNRAYDNSGRLTSYTDPLGQTQTMSYDNRNRLNSTVYPDALGTQTLGYDPAGNLTSNSYSDGTSLSFIYDAKNRLVSANGLTLNYNAIDRLISSNGIGIIRDPASRITQMTLAPAKVVTYAYDANDRVIQISDWLGGITTFSYDDAGNLTNIGRPNGINATKGYDNDGRLISLTEGSISSIVLTRNANGDTTAAIRNVPLVASAANLSSNTSSVNAASQLNSSTYDALGRTLTDGTNTFVWDLNNRLKSLTNSAGTTTYTYDATGKRLTKTNAGVTQSYVWNYAFGLPTISVEEIDGVDTKHYVQMPNGNLLYSVDALTNASQYYHFDERGNTLFITDDNGDVIGSYAYSAFGKLIAELGNLDNQYKWQGQFGIITEDDNYYYIRDRYYDANSGRFISRDSVNSTEPTQINPYQYALSNPINYVDINGQNAVITSLVQLDGTPFLAKELSFQESILLSGKFFNKAGINASFSNAILGQFFGGLNIFGFSHEKLFPPNDDDDYRFGGVSSSSGSEQNLVISNSSDTSSTTIDNVLFAVNLEGNVDLELTDKDARLAPGVNFDDLEGFLTGITTIDITLPNGNTLREAYDLHAIWDKNSSESESTAKGDLQ